MGVIRRMAKVVVLALIFAVAQGMLMALGASAAGAKGGAFVMALLTGPVWNAWLTASPAGSGAAVPGQDA